MLTPRENMLRILRHEPAECTPITVYSDSYRHPGVDSMPEPLTAFPLMIGSPSQVTKGNTQLQSYVNMDGKEIVDWHNPADLSLAASLTLGVPDASHPLRPGRSRSRNTGCNKTPTTSPTLTRRSQDT